MDKYNKKEDVWIQLLDDLTTNTEKAAKDSSICLETKN